MVKDNVIRSGRLLYLKACSPLRLRLVAGVQKDSRRSQRYPFLTVLKVVAPTCGRYLTGSYSPLTESPIYPVLGDFQ